MQVSFYDIVFWEKQHIFLPQMAEIKHEGNKTYNKHRSSQKISKKTTSFSLTSLLMPSLLN